jgi:XRE family transcriptional regulator, regulator of sulfur utilization
MTLSRRNLALLLPALAATAKAQTAARQMPSKVLHSGQLPYSGDEKKKGRQFFRGANHSGFDIEMHETVLGPGVETHPPHKHEDEEIVIVMEGSVESYLEGKRDVAEAGSVIVNGSNQMHTVKNAGTTPCRYYVIELRGKA